MMDVLWSFRHNDVRKFFDKGVPSYQRGTFFFRQSTIGEPA